jgi:hypothetical protein
MDFGLITTVNQIHNLHPNVLNYVNNLITFKAFDKRDIAVLKNFMNLQELHGSGYYSRNRKESYQIAFLKGMKVNEVLTKRTDINQPYPVILDVEKLEKMKPLSKGQIIDYMEGQGYNLRDSENQILSDTKKTLFEQHFGHYYKFLDEIIKFFSILQKLDNIGNLYRAKIKEELLKIISPKAKTKVGNDKTQIKAIRDNIFELFLKYGYIIEAHPRKASGSQSIRPSYAIGPQYQASIDDYYEVNKEKPTKVSIDVISQESNDTESIENLFLDKDDASEDLDIQLEPIEGSITSSSSISQKEIINTLIDNLGQLFARLARINQYINKKEYGQALSMEQNAIKTFLINFYSDCHSKQSQEHSNITLKLAIDFFLDSLELSITPKYLNSLIHLSQDIENSETNVGDVLSKGLNLLLDFFHRLQGEIKNLLT